MLGLAEIVVFFVSVYLGVIIRFYDWQSYQIYSIEGSMQSIFPRAVIFTLIMFGVLTAMGLYQRDYREGPKSTFVRIISSFFYWTATYVPDFLHGTKPDFWAAEHSAWPFFVP